jgi:hypothetical protein
VENKVKNLENFFWMFLIINPILDILNGLYIYYLDETYGYIYEEASLSMTPTLVFRMCVLVLFILYVIRLRDKKSILCALPIGVAWAMSVVSELFFSSASVALFTDVQYIAKFCYNIGVVFAYTLLFRRSTLSHKELMDKINHLLCYTLMALSLAILIPYSYGGGLTTYADRFGYRGARGYFYSGNDITAIFMLLLPVVTCYFMSRKPEDLTRKTRVLYTLASAFTCICLCLIGTKTAFLSVGVTMGVLLAYSVILMLMKKGSAPFKRIVMIIVITGVVMVALSLANQSLFNDISESLNTTSQVVERDGTVTAIMSGRQDKLRNAVEQYLHSGIVGKIFGIGRGSQEFVIEMDVFEVFCYYGIFGAIAMLWLYLKLGFSFVFKFFHKVNLMTIGVFLSLLLCSGYLVMAGHVLFSVTSGFYFALMLVYSKWVVKDEDTPEKQPEEISQ